VALNADVMRGPFASESYIRFVARASRRTCTPDVAIELARIWNDTDVRDVLPAVQAPLLMIDFDNEHCRGLLRYLADRAPRTETHFIPESLVMEDLALMHDAIRRFLGVERPAVGLDSMLATVVFTDVVGSTELAARIGDARWKELIAAHDTRARAEVERYRGVFVDSAGDGLLARFEGPARAVRCARAIAEAVRPLGLEVRAGCHTGEVELDGEHVRGLAVHIGARVAAMAGVGEVWTTSTVVDGEGPHRRLGPHVRGRGRARAEGRARPVASLPGDGLTAGADGSSPAEPIEVRRRVTWGTLVLPGAREHLVQVRERVGASGAAVDQQVRLHRALALDVDRAARLAREPVPDQLVGGLGDLDLAGDAG
jgi:class 3 adenylate cyclase